MPPQAQYFIKAVILRGEMMGGLAGLYLLPNLLNFHEAQVWGVNWRLFSPGLWTIYRNFCCNSQWSFSIDRVRHRSHQFHLHKIPQEAEESAGCWRCLGGGGHLLLGGVRRQETQGRMDNTSLLLRGCSHITSPDFDGCVSMWSAVQHSWSKSSMQHLKTSHIGCDKPKKQWMVNANCFAVRPSPFRLIINIFRVLSLAITQASREDKEIGLVS